MEVNGGKCIKSNAFNGKSPLGRTPEILSVYMVASLVSSSLPAKTSRNFKGHSGSHSTGGNTEPTWVFEC